MDYLKGDGMRNCRVQYLRQCIVPRLRIIFNRVRDYSKSCTTINARHVELLCRRVTSPAINKRKAATRTDNQLRDIEDDDDHISDNKVSTTRQ